MSEHKAFKCTVELNSKLNTPLEADIIWGHIVWALKYLEGKDKAEELISSYDSVPPIILSDGFPSGYLPRPLYDPNLISLENIIKSFPEISFSRKKMLLENIIFSPLLPSSTVFSLMENPLKLSDLARDLFKCHICPLLLLPVKKMKKTKTVRKLINSTCKSEHCFCLSGNSEADCNQITSNFLDRAEIYPAFYRNRGLEGEKWDIYILSTIEKEKIEKLLKFIGENGFGKNASRGKGIFTIKNFLQLSQQERPDKYKGRENGFMTLSSSYIPLPGEVENIEKARYKLQLKIGKLGGHWSSMKNFCKYPLVLFKAGSVFPATPGIKRFWGQMKKGVHPVLKEVVQYGWAFPVWGNLFEER